jgi:hypothetical protein
MKGFLHALCSFVGIQECFVSMIGDCLPDGACLFLTGSCVFSVCLGKVRNVVSAL